ncbi:MAG TPA: glycerol-3-phosphate dehydrogenase, partial [Alphaproteobacteria bacterium]|nr:glycerol-3-phosphate dehydrogenase [Alphaproteobacteria bacterium]
MASTPQPLDILVIGGGVNGTGIARDAAGRGYAVMLCEMNDLASGTSSAATKLVHGGLRYLEYYKFRLVHESLAEREVLWASAPHIIWPLRFVLPHVKGMRPAWLLRLGLFVYDHLGGRKLLPGTRTLDLRRDESGRPLKPHYRLAFEYSDGWVNDARLVVLNARDAADRGADIRTRTRVVAARREGAQWSVEIDGPRGRETVAARLLVNAAGPWVDRVIAQALGQTGARHVRLVKGSHIVTRRLYEHERCYFLQNDDGRPVFAIPYENDFTLIGTTDLDYAGDPAEVTISEAETDYLLRAVNAYFATPVGREDIVWTYSGVRPLFDDGASASKEATRDYVLKLEGDGAAAPVLNVFGGKLTTYRRLSQKAVDMIAQRIGARGEPWTGGGTLPGGDFPATGFEGLVAKLKESYPGLEAALVRRLARTYGTCARELLGDARTEADLGEHFGADLYAREVDYLMTYEWAVAADDVLWRRSKLGLRTSPRDRERL